MTMVRQYSGTCISIQA